MPMFLVVEPLKPRQRKQNRNELRARDEPTARKLAAKWGWEIEAIERVPDPIASPELVAAAHSLNLGISPGASHDEAVVSILLRMSDLKRQTRCRVGDDYWGFVQAIRIMDSEQGLRIECDVTTDASTDTGIYVHPQGSGRRRYLPSDIDELQLTDDPFADMTPGITFRLG